MEKAMLGCSSMLIFDYKGGDACILGGHEFGETMSSAKGFFFRRIFMSEANDGDVFTGQYPVEQSDDYRKQSIRTIESFLSFGIVK